MRLLTVSCALALLSALAVAGCGGWTGAASQNLPAGSPENLPAGSLFLPVATVDQIMDAIVVPGSQAIFDAVVYSNGTLVQAPANDDDWFRLRMQALSVAESGNLLVMPTRARDAAWVSLARAMTERAAAVAAAAEAKDLERLLETGSQLYGTCTGCHLKYLMEQP
jgi:hypothetical protein